MKDFKHYCDLQVIRNLPLINNNEIIASSSAINLIETEWNEYMSAGTMERYQYTDRQNGKKYEHRFEYTLEKLMPTSLTVDE